LDPDRETPLLRVAGIAAELRQLPGVRVDVVTKPGILSSLTSERPTRFRVAHGALCDPIPAALDWLHELDLADLVLPTR
jgi:hypothetical protein